MKSLVSVQYLRAFSMLYIVGYWHLFNYTAAFEEFNNFFTYKLTLIVLGLFVFISGFLLGSPAKKSVSLLDFYRKRLIRIYPLYAMAVIFFYFHGIINGKTSVNSLLLLSMFYGPTPQTLWFVTMIMVFYLVTPLLLKLVAAPVRYLFFCIGLFSVILILRTAFHTVDYRILLYFPCFCVGIYCSRYGLITRFVNMWSGLLLLLFWLMLSPIAIDSWLYNPLKSIPMILSCTYLIFLFSYRYESKFKNLRIISFLSYSSYTMYLFHRPIYTMLKALYFPENSRLQVLYLLTLGLAAVSLVSWGIQKLYDTSYLAVKRQIA